ncbi:MAG: response regulator transcription factor [Oscillospiraceae bacterium]|nr:response regulator transcription factor [Oscillospiraceae bacterium]
MDNGKILIIEDDPPIRNLISTTLKAHGYAFICATCGEEGISMTASHNPDVIFLDLGLPDIDGTQVIERIRSWSKTPIIVISARTEESDKIEALDLGADDYLTKPFSVEELLARLRVNLRRMAFLRNESGSHEYINGDLKIDYSAACVYVKDTEVHLTPIEYKLLCLLAQNTGKVLTHRYIMDHVYGNSWENDVATLRVFMAGLRKKLQPDEDSAQLIQTHIGIGYRMVRPD